MVTNENKGIILLKVFAFFAFIVSIGFAIWQLIFDFKLNGIRCQSPRGLCYSFFGVIRSWIKYYQYSLLIIPLIVAVIFLVLIFFIKKIPEERKKLRTFLFYSIFVLEFLIFLCALLFIWQVFQPDYF